jgi:serine/threonine-protein kinase
VIVGTPVRVNVSKGPRPVLVPNVIGQPYANAESALQGAGFSVRRQNVDSDDPKDTVVGTDPPGGNGAAPNSTVTVRVSKGPKVTSIPDVTSYSQADAEATLKDAGFGVTVQTNPTTDPALDGVVISQDPPGGTKAKPGTAVTIVVGQLVVETPAPPATTTTIP